MLVDEYRKAIRGIFDKVDATQTEQIEAAAEMIAQTVKDGGCVHIYDTGHIINCELVRRAGGLAILRGLTYAFTVTDDAKNRDMSGKDRSMEGLGVHILRQSNVLCGDLLILGSVSGKTALVTDLAIAAREMGVKTVGVTSITYSSALKSDHSCGKRLFELCDLVIDNCAPKGDAMIDYEGLEHPFGPASGLSAAYIMWQVSAMTADKLLEAGIQPTVFKSVNFPDGWDTLERDTQTYMKEGR